MKRQQPSGVLLLLALVMMALVLSAALVLGTVIVRELRLAQVADKGVTAFYASETAAEDAVYHIFKLGEEAQSLPTSGALSGGSSWTRLVKKTESEFVFDFVAKDETVAVSLYNMGKASQAAQVESLSMEWTSGQSLELAVSEWDGAALGSSTTQACTTSPCINNAPRSDRGYYITITARGAAATDLTVSLYSGDGASGTLVGVEIPVTVLATGHYLGAQQAVELRLPVPAPWEGTPVPPSTQTCGNGATEGTETCDDGNTTSGDGCSATCQIEASLPPVCGDALVEVPETCDSDALACTAAGNYAGTAACNNTCDGRLACVAGESCGDSVINGPEICDDGNTTNAGLCLGNCSGPTYCGDNYPQNPNGVGLLGFSGVGDEECDAGTAGSNLCNPRCQRCGNGRVDFGEQCDDGNENFDDGCSQCAKLYSPVIIAVSSSHIYTIPNITPARVWKYNYTGSFIQSSPASVSCGSLLCSVDNVFTTNSSGGVVVGTSLNKQWGGYQYGVGVLDGNFNLVRYFNTHSTTTWPDYNGSIATDASGNIYVLHNGEVFSGSQAKIDKYNSSGSLLKSWTPFTAAEARGVAQIATNNATSTLYVLYIDTNYAIRKFDTNGTPGASWNVGTDSYASIAQDSAGNVYYIGSSSTTVKKYNSAGTLLGQWDSNLGFPYAQVNSSIAINSVGEIFISGSTYRFGTYQASNGYVARFNSSGTLISKFP